MTSRPASKASRLGGSESRLGGDGSTFSFQEGPAMESQRVLAKEWVQIPSYGGERMVNRDMLIFFQLIFFKKKSIVPFSWTKPQNIGTSPKASQHLPFHEESIGFLSWAWTKEPQGRLLQQPIQPQVIEKLGVWRLLLFKEHHPHVYIYIHNYINIYIITKLCIHYVCIYGNGISKYLLRWISIVRLNMLFAGGIFRDPSATSGGFSVLGDSDWSDVCCSATLWFPIIFHEHPRMQET